MISLPTEWRGYKSESAIESVWKTQSIYSSSSNNSGSDFVLRAAIIFNGINGAYKIRLVTNDFVSFNQEQILHDTIAKSKTSQTKNKESSGGSQEEEQCMQFNFIISQSKSDSEK